MFKYIGRGLIAAILLANFGAQGATLALKEKRSRLMTALAQLRDEIDHLSVSQKRKLDSTHYLHLKGLWERVFIPLREEISPRFFREYAWNYGQYSRPVCTSAVVNGSPPRAYVISGSGRINFCESAFRDKDLTDLKQIIIHEYMHRSGVLNECAADEIALAYTYLVHHTVASLTYSEPQANGRSLCPGNLAMLRRLDQSLVDSREALHENSEFRLSRSFVGECANQIESAKKYKMDPEVMIQTQSYALCDVVGAQPDSNDWVETHYKITSIKIDPSEKTRTRTLIDFGAVNGSERFRLECFSGGRFLSKIPT